MSSQKAQILWTSLVAITFAVLALYQTFSQTPSPSSLSTITNRTPTSDLVGGSEFR